MNKHILSLTAGVLFTTGAFTQEIAHTASLTVPMPLNFAHAGDAIQNYAASAGMRYTFRSAGDLSMALAAAHEWRNTRLYRGVQDGTEMYTDLSGRAFQFQVLGLYKIGTCTHTCGGEFSALLGADLSLPYGKRSQPVLNNESGVSRSVGLGNRTGFGLHAGLMMRKALCSHLGFFVQPEVGYRVVLDHPDYVELLGLPEQKNDLSSRFTLGLQMGIYLKLEKSMCPARKG